MVCALTDPAEAQPLAGGVELLTAWTAQRDPGSTWAPTVREWSTCAATETAAAEDPFDDFEDDDFDDEFDDDFEEDWEDDLTEDDEFPDTFGGDDAGEEEGEESPFSDDPDFDED